MLAEKFDRSTEMKMTLTHNPYLCVQLYIFLQTRFYLNLSHMQLIERNLVAGAIYLAERYHKYSAICRLKVSFAD